MNVGVKLHGGNTMNCYACDHARRIEGKVKCTRFNQEVDIMDTCCLFTSKEVKALFRWSKELLRRKDD